MAKLIKARRSATPSYVDGLDSRRMRSLIAKLDLRGNEAYDAMSAVVASGTRAVPHLLAALASASEPGTMRIIFAMSESGDTRSIEALTLLASKSAKQIVRKHAADALRKIYKRHNLMSPELIMISEDGKGRTKQLN